MWARTFALVVLIAGLGLSATAAEPAIEYKLFASSDGRYKALFPGPVKTETSDVKTPNGNRKLTFDSVQVAEGLIFMVTYVDVPDDVAKSPPGPRLDKIRDGNKGAEGKVLLDKEVSVGVEKLPGRDIVIEKSNSAIRNRAVIAGNRLYQVMIQGQKDFVVSKVADRFIESFEPTK